MDINIMSFEELWDWIEENAIENEEMAKEIMLYLSIELRSRGYVVILNQVYEERGEKRLHVFNFYETNTFNRMEALREVAKKIQKRE
ncbi:hypothetical protein [Alkaliphilus sp. B6464]|uniref:hypothetical protein n=1 Tax=Alkaliphilus sp. B6464 TaxID=2731219 RepID=UPI001BA740AE|nr:hypothetical protein [Alkaliphilus sp. B6464]QUH22188.1 hypothetical protein HYG84_19980 [Alkaliphilus sp. B6464]